MSVPQSILLVSPWLGASRGAHQFNYARTIHDVARAAGIDFKAAGFVQAEQAVKDHLPFLPIFHGRGFPGQPTLPILRTIAHYRQYGADLDALAAHKLGRDWVVFVESVYHVDLLAWAAWLRRLDPSTAPTFVFMLRVDPQERLRPAATLYQLALARLRGVSSRIRIRLVSDSKLLARQYRSLTTLPVSVLPIPHTLPHHEAPVRQAEGPIRLASLGPATATKAFDVLAAAVVRLIEHDQMTGLDFRLQCFCMDGTPSHVVAAIESLRNHPHPAVELLDTSLDEKAYHELIARTDGILIPYSRRAYRTATSGPFTEALALGKPLVVTDGTWMSAQLPEFGAGITFRDGDPEDLARAILELRDNYPLLATQARERGPKWAAYHNPDNFLQTLLAIATD